MTSQENTRDNDSIDALKRQATGQFDDIAGAASRTFHEAADQAERFANRVADDGRAVGDSVQEVAGNLQGAVVKSVKEQPLATIALVAVLGFVLGAIWKS